MSHVSSSSCFDNPNMNLCITQVLSMNVCMKWMVSLFLRLVTDPETWSSHVNPNEVETMIDMRRLVPYNHLRPIAQMFWIIKRWVWFYTSPVSVCLSGAAPVVQMCMTKMNHHTHTSHIQTWNTPLAKINFWYRVHLSYSILICQYFSQKTKELKCVMMSSFCSLKCCRCPFPVKFCIEILPV